MRLVGKQPERLASVPYRAAGPGGVPQNVQLSVEQLSVDRLPAGCDALLAAGEILERELRRLVAENHRPTGARLHG